MKEILAHLGTFRLILLLCCIPLAVLAYFCKFVLPGYSFSALVCTALIGVILFYVLMPFVGLKFPVFARWATRIFSVCLVIGLVIYACTEAVIIYYSFGSSQKETPYLLVLGAKVNDMGPSVSLWDRIYAAHDYLEAHPDTIAIVSGGQGKDEPMTEALCMFTHLVDMGIDPKRIVMEDQATSTWENLHFSLDLIEKKFGERPTELAVLSSEYHLFRASLFTKACGLDFIGIPARTSRVSQMINHFMREVAGVWHYILLGGHYS